jgi:hypothetical protein
LIARTFWEVAAEAPWSFVIGIVAGFILSNRWKIIRRNGGPKTHE